MNEIDVLGTTYTIRRVDWGQDACMEVNQLGGYCSFTTKEILLLNLKTCPDFMDEPKTCIEALEKQTMRHEIIHAFLNESGLRYNSAECRAWASNEEMVDWFALQMPKLLKVFKATRCI